VKLLLDTAVFLWWRENSPILSPASVQAIATADVVFVSAVSAWEVAIKRGLGRLRLDASFEEGVADSRFSTLDVCCAHAAALDALEVHHVDPFDRMLLAQARVEYLTIVTHDQAFAPYGQPIIWA
jgi:PIN domain nuclease of toxin-antitoxin system